MVLQQQLDSTKLNKVTPLGPRPFSFFENLGLIDKPLHLELHKYAKEYGNVFKISLGGKKFIALNGLEAITEALVTQHDNFNARADFLIYKQAPQRFFLEAKGGEVWKKHRGVAAQVSRNYMVSRTSLVESWAQEEAVDLSNLLIKTNGQPFDPGLYVPVATLNFMQRLMFDKRDNLKELEENSEFVKVGRSITKLNEGAGELFKLLFMPKIWQPIFILSSLKSFREFFKTGVGMERYIVENIEQHRNSFDPENLRDLTDGLLQANTELTESDKKDLGLSENDIVKGTLMQFLGAGTEATDVMLRWALLYMAAYPEIQAQIQKELDEVIGRENQPGLEHRGKLPFTEACINEIFRHSSASSLPAFVYATTTDTTLQGYFIPEKTPILINYYSLNRDERYWKEPETFNPYRFLDENGKTRNNLLDKFYPFGIGPRRCIGEYFGRLIVFLYFTTMMHKCKVEKVPGEELSLEPLPIGLLTPQRYKIIAKSRF